MHFINRVVLVLTQRLNDLTSDKQFSDVFIGSVWALSSRLLATLLGLASTVLIARLYGAGVMGIVAILNTFLSLATIFTILGTDTSLLRLIPEFLVKYSVTSAYNVYRRALFMVVAVSLATGILLYFSSDFIARVIFVKPYLSFYFALSSTFLVFKSLELLNAQAIRGLRLIRSFALMQSLPQINLFILLLLLGWLWPTNDVPVYAQLGGFFFSGITGWIIMEYAFRARMNPLDFVEKLPFREFLTISLPMLMTSTMVFVIGQTGVIMLGMMRSDVEVGYYSIAVKLATLTTFILNAINSMAAPKFSELYHSGNIDDLFYVAYKSAKLIFWTTTPIIIGLIIAGRLVLTHIFGQEFEEAYSALVLLTFGQFVNSISGATGIFMNMTGNQKHFRDIMFFVALANVGLSILLIPRYGIVGASFSAMVSTICWNSIALIYIKNKFGKTTGYFPLLY